MCHCSYDRKLTTDLLAGLGVHEDTDTPLIVRWVTGVAAVKLAAVDVSVLIASPSALPLA